MSTSYYGDRAEITADLSGILSSADINKMFADIGKPAGSLYNIEVTSGADGYTVDASNDAYVDLETTAKADGLEATARMLDGGFQNIGYLDTGITDDENTPINVVAASSEFIELQGAATVDGLSAPTFVVDASHDTASTFLKASSGRSFLMGGQGPGSDTLTGSTSTTGSAALVAGNANTQILGGLGQDTLIGGGNTTMTGGSGAGQLLEDFTLNSHDSITAGIGGTEQIAVVGGSNIINDGPGTNDSIYAGSGTDTIYGSTSPSGSTIALYQGNSSVVSATSDNITIAAATLSHSDTITASTSGLDQVTFAGHSASEVQGLVTTAENAPGFTGDSVTISFGTVDGVTQTATLNNVSHIHFN